jgi:hypothetical protein
MPAEVIDFEKARDRLRARPPTQPRAAITAPVKSPPKPPAITAPPDALLLLILGAGLYAFFTRRR